MTKNVYVKESGIHGKGVFASKDFKRGSITYIIKGKIRDFFVKNKKTALYGPDWVGFAHNKWIEPSNDDPTNYLNHSCEPSCGVKGRFCIVALGNINKDQEVTIDYSITEDQDLWTMECSCGSKKCRGVISSIQKTPGNVLSRYLPYIPTYFKKKYVQK